jgi:hypothetical protein
VQPVIPASFERGETAAVHVPASLPDSVRFADLPSHRAEPRRADVPTPATRLSMPAAEVPAEVVVRIAPAVPAEKPSRVAPTLTMPRREAAPATLAPREEAPSAVQPAASASRDAAPVEREAIEQAPVIPRVERPTDTFVPFARRESAIAPATPDTTATLRQRVPAAARRPVDVRIGAIEVHLTSPAPPAPSDRPALAGFEEYAAVRNAVRFDGE